MRLIHRHHLLLLLPLAASAKGIFLSCKISYENRSAEDQAKEILAHVQSLVNKGYEKVGITFSANSSETAAINGKSGVAANRYQDVNFGDRQAAVMRAVAKILDDDAKKGENEQEYKKVSEAFCIIPVTTIQEAKGSEPRKAPTEDAVTADIKKAEAFLEGHSKAVILGWQNQDTPQGSYAIGGGETQKVGGCEERIDQAREGVKSLAKKYAPKSDAALSPSSSSLS